MPESGEGASVEVMVARRKERLGGIMGMLDLNAELIIKNVPEALQEQVRGALKKEGKRELGVKHSLQIASEMDRGSEQREAIIERTAQIASDLVTDTDELASAIAGSVKVPEKEWDSFIDSNPESPIARVIGTVRDWRRARVVVGDWIPDPSGNQEKVDRWIGSNDPVTRAEEDGMSWTDPLVPIREDDRNERVLEVTVDTVSRLAEAASKVACTAFAGVEGPKKKAEGEKRKQLEMLGEKLVVVEIGAESLADHALALTASVEHSRNVREQKRNEAAGIEEGLVDGGESPEEKAKDRGDTLKEGAFKRNEARLELRGRFEERREQFQEELMNIILGGSVGKFRVKPEVDERSKLFVERYIRRRASQAGGEGGRKIYTVEGPESVSQLPVEQLIRSYNRKVDEQIHPAQIDERTGEIKGGPLHEQSKYVGLTAEALLNAGVLRSDNQADVLASSVMAAAALDAIQPEKGEKFDISLSEIERNAVDLEVARSVGQIRDIVEGLDQSAIEQAKIEWEEAKREKDLAVEESNKRPDDSEAFIRKLEAEGRCNEILNRFGIERLTATLESMIGGVDVAELDGAEAVAKVYKDEGRASISRVDIAEYT